VGGGATAGSRAAGRENGEENIVNKTHPGI